MLRTKNLPLYLFQLTGRRGVSTGEASAQHTELHVQCTLTRAANPSSSGGGGGAPIGDIPITIENVSE